jgi:hypothetical protein
VTRFTAALLAVVLLTASPAASADEERPGRWRFKHEDRPVKAVIVGGSVSAWPRGGYGQFLQAVCSRVEIVNRGKARLGARALRQRVKMQVLRNRRIDLTAHESTWLIFHGGLNSISTPQSTNRNVARVLLATKAKGLGTIGLTVSPWGSEGDRRWRRAGGLRYRAWTQQSVDFLMGRSTPEQAFGPSRAATDYAEGERPDIAVDLYDSALRDAEAPLRDAGRLQRFVTIDDWVKGELKGVTGDERNTRITAFTQQARELPRWYMKRELHAFDHVHPGMEGHRLIAKTMCPKMPETWGCACDALDGLSWDRKAGGLVRP